MRPLPPLRPEGMPGSPDQTRGLWASFVRWWIRRQLRRGPVPLVIRMLKETELACVDIECDAKDVLWAMDAGKLPRRPGARALLSWIALSLPSPEVVDPVVRIKELASKHGARYEVRRQVAHRLVTELRAGRMPQDAASLKMYHEAIEELSR